MDKYFHFRGKTFRKAFQCLKDLQAFFPGVPRLGLSATVTLEEEREIVKSLGMVKASIVRENPDRPNIYLEKVLKDSAADSYELYENIYKPLVDKLVILKSKFPVTLVYMPLEHIGNASAYCRYVFKTDLQTSLYGIICSGQDSQVKSTILDDLGTECPRFRLVFCTSVIGMGFNSPSIERVIHSRPPRNLPDYVQEIGRAGRSGQDAQATLYFCKRDIAANVPGIKSDIIGYCNEDMCLRDNLLKQFGFKNSFIVPMHKCCSYCKNICNCFECEMFRIEL